MNSNTFDLGKSGTQVHVKSQTSEWGSRLKCGRGAVDHTRNRDLEGGGCGSIAS